VTCTRAWAMRNRAIRIRRVVGDMGILKHGIGNGA
jgi:hypothetical protein